MYEFNEDELIDLICNLVSCGIADLDRLLKVVKVLRYLNIYYDWFEIIEEVGVEKTFNVIIGIAMEMILDKLNYPIDSVFVDWADSWYGVEELDEILWKDDLKYEEVKRLEEKNNE